MSQILIGYHEVCAREIEDNLRAEALNPNALWERGDWILKLLKDLKYHKAEIIRLKADLPLVEVVDSHSAPLLEYINEITQFNDALERR